MSLVAGLSLINKVWSRRPNWIMIWNPCQWWRGFFLTSRRFAKISFKFYGQSTIFGWFVRKQNVFYGQTVIFSNLSVNFWPLWWEFTDKAGFLEYLSVKPGPKRLNFYGQTAVFDHFVRNRHFSGRPFTDKLSIFSDLSVNGSDFDKCSAAHHLLNYCTWPRLRAKRWFL